LISHRTVDTNPSGHSFVEDARRAQIVSCVAEVFRTALQAVGPRVDGVPKPVSEEPCSARFAPNSTTRRSRTTPAAQLEPAGVAQRVEPPPRDLSLARAADGERGRQTGERDRLPGQLP
jgi:hypothetical protein